MTRLRSLLLSLAFLALLAPLVVAQDRSDPNAPERLEELLEPLRKKHDLVALGGAIVHKGKITAIGATGLRRAGGTEPVTIEDKWHLGSCTKSMTATLIGMLVEDGALSFESKVTEVLKEQVETIHPGWNEVTIEQLLAHRGGAPAHLGKDGLWKVLWEREGSPRDQRLRLARGVLKHPPEALPGAVYVYANSGYAIAGVMTEAVTGKDWETLMRERLFDPLGMSSAGFSVPGSAKAVDQPFGHVVRGKEHRERPPGPKVDNPPAIGPAGTVHASLSDWAKYLAIHLDRGAQGKALLKPATFARLHRPVPKAASGYALGWSVARRRWGGKEYVLNHAGSNNMWYCVCWLAPGRDFGVLIVTNQAGANTAKACDEAAGALIQEHGRSR
ncbi:MAG: serine hydrolase domain-containing protein [Planctomycetota bacterium]|jgi:CubicO group peptidase (beta-lactamase class C family)